MFLKIKNRSNKKHLAFIRELVCVKCLIETSNKASRSPCHAHHIRKGTDGGMGLKPSDKWTVPLCEHHHRECHDKGELTFYGGEEGLPDWHTLACDLHRVSGDRREAIKILMSTEAR